MWKCTECDLCMRSSSLPPVGNKLADIMLILNHPDYYENKSNEVLNSPKGDHIQLILNSIGLNKDLIYITYITKCKPIDFATDYQIHNCSNLYLKKELKKVKPKIIITFDYNVIVNLNKVLNINLHTFDWYQTTKDYVIFHMPNPVKYSKQGENAYPIDKAKPIGIFYKKFINPFHLY